MNTITDFLLITIVLASLVFIAVKLSGDYDKAMELCQINHSYATCSHSLNR